MSVDLRTLAQSPAAFRANLVVPGAGGAVRLGDALHDFQREFWAAVDPALSALKAGTTPPVTRFWRELTKSCSKTTDNAVAILWLTLFSPRPLTIRVGAADSEQSDETRLRALAITRLNRWMIDGKQPLIEVLSDRIVNPTTGSVCRILSTDAAGVQGSTPSLSICDEFTHAKGDSGRDFLLGMLDDADKRPDSVVICCGNAGFLNSWQHTFRENARTSPDWWFQAYTRPAPWVTEASLRDAANRNPRSRFLRLWQGVWSGADGDALDEGDVKAALTQRGPMSGAETGFQFVCGIDVGIRHDRTAVVVLGKHVGHVEEIEQPVRAVNPMRAAAADLGLLPTRNESRPATVEHPGTGRLRLAGVKVWAAPKGGTMDLEAVEEAVIEADELFGFAAVAYDPHQAEYLAERLGKRGLPVVPVHPTGPNLREMAGEMLRVFRDREIELFDDPNLSADLSALRLAERSFGTRLVSPRDASGHGDAATGLALCLWAARDLTLSGFGGVEGSLVYGD
jgi:hypothetical protein